MWRSDIPKSCPTSVECSRKLKNHRKKRTLLNSVRFFRAGKMQRKKGDEAEKSQGDNTDRAEHHDERDDGADVADEEGEDTLPGELELAALFYLLLQ